METAARHQEDADGLPHGTDGTTAQGWRSVGSVWLNGGPSVVVSDPGKRSVRSSLCMVARPLGKQDRTRHLDVDVVHEGASVTTELEGRIACHSGVR